MRASAALRITSELFFKQKPSEERSFGGFLFCGGGLVDPEHLWFLTTALSKCTGVVNLGSRVRCF